MSHWKEHEPPAGMPVRMTEQVAAPPKRRPHQLSLLVLGAAVAVAALVVAWLMVKGGSSSASSYGHPALVSQPQLERFARSLDHPVYWAGPKAGFSYELTAAPSRVWVRYLPAGVAAGDSRSNFLVVGTYRQPHSYANLVRAVGRPGSVSRKIAGGGVMVYSSAKPTSVYFGYPGTDYQVEVYSRSSRTARSLVLDGTITQLTR